MNIPIKDTTLDDPVHSIEAGEHIKLTRADEPFAKIQPATH